jgi:membrane protein
VALKERLADVPVLGTALAVKERYEADLGNHLAASIAFFGFLSLFPLALLGLSVAGFVLAGDVAAQQEIADTVTEAVPGLGVVLGDAIETAVATRGVTGLVGLIGVLLAGLRVIAIATEAISRVHRVEIDDNAVVAKARALGNLLVLGTLAILATSAGAVAGFVGRAGDVVGLPDAVVRGVAAPLLSFALDFVLFVVAYRVLAASRGPRWEHLWPGAVLAAVGWTALKVFGATYVGNQAANWDAVYGALGGIIAAMLLLFLAARIFLYGAQLNAVRCERPDGLLHTGDHRPEASAAGPDHGDAITPPPEDGRRRPAPLGSDRG